MAEFRRQFCGWMVVALLLGSAPPLWSQSLTVTAPQWRLRHAEALQMDQPGRQVEHLSAGFLGLPYVVSPLIGSPTQDEVLVNDLVRVDCFTLLDFVEALRRSVDLSNFDQTLLQVRYQGAELSYRSRHHFFSAWGDANRPHLRDVTADVAGPSLQRLEKILNRKQDGGLWLEGIPTWQRELAYLPTAALDGVPLARLQTGDYVGIVSPLPGLDVSHTGILLWREETLYLRHASSRASTGKVLDEPLLPYLQGKPGLVVLRPTTPPLSPHNPHSEINCCIENVKSPMLAK